MNFTKKLKSYKLQANKAFTLIEVLISVSMIVILATISVNYGNSARQQFALTRAQSQLVGLFNHVKSLSQNFVFTPPDGYRICAYGIHVDDEIDNEFIVFNDLVDEGEDCEDDGVNGVNTYNSGEELSGQINRFQIDDEILEFRGSDLEDVVFIPPTPEVIINGNEEIKSALVRIHIKDQPTNFELKINKFGQINIE